MKRLSGRFRLCSRGTALLKSTAITPTIPTYVLRVGYRVADHVLQEHLEDATCLLVDQAGDALNSAAAGKAANGGFLEL